MVGDSVTVDATGKVGAESHNVWRQLAMTGAWAETFFFGEEVNVNGGVGAAYRQKGHTMIIGSAPR